MIVAVLANISRCGRRMHLDNEPEKIGKRSLKGSADGRKKRPFRRFILYFLAFLLAIGLGVAAFLLYEFHSLGFIDNLPIVKQPSPSATPIPSADLTPSDGSISDNPNADVGPAAGKTPIYAQTPIDPNVVNILVLGLDTRTPGGNGRSDINLIVSIDRKNNKIKLVSLLRDTLVPIEGHDWDRLNSAYAFGGPGLSINTINSAYKLDIQRYVKIDFFGIQTIVDAMGGVDVTLTQAEVDYLRSYGHNVSKGPGIKHLDGATALAYARTRDIDSDFQRTQRQRNVMTALLSKARGMGVMQAIGLMTKLLPQVKTNISTGETVDLAKAVLAMGSGDLKQMTAPVINSYTNKKYKGMAILSVDFDKNASSIRTFLYGGQ